MQALVTGGKGFIGSHLAETLLNLGHKVLVLDNIGVSERNIKHLIKRETINNFDYLSCDIRKAGARAMVANLIKNCKIDTVFHLAGLADIVPSIQNPTEYFATNVMGTLNMLEAAREYGKLQKFVYTSSSSIYGIPEFFEIPTSEEIPIKPQYPYAETKYQGERWVSHYGQIYKLPVISLRLFNVYGPRSRTTGTYGAVFGTFLAQKINGKPFTVVGDGKQARDFTFVADVCDAFVRAANSKISGEVFNVGSGKPQTILRLVELLGGDIVHVPKRPGEPDKTCADILKIKTALGWTPKVSFEEGVKIMLDNIDYWRNAPVWTPDSIGEATKDWFEFLGGKEGK